MVNVEKIGKLKKHYIKCAICNSELSFDKTDENTELQKDQAILGERQDYYIICPICKNKVFTRSIIKSRGYFEYFK